MNKKKKGAIDIGYTSISTEFGRLRSNFNAEKKKEERNGSSINKLQLFLLIFD
jgi:hypothetical protein